MCARVVTNESIGYSIRSGETGLAAGETGGKS